MSDSPSLIEVIDPVAQGLAQPRMPPTAVDPDDLVRLWIMRLVAHHFGSDGGMRLCGHGGMAAHLRGQRLSGMDRSPDIMPACAMVGLDRPPEGVGKAEALRLVRAQLQRRIHRLERRLRPVTWLGAIDPNLGQSIRAVSGVLGLDDVEMQCLAFLHMLRCHEHLRTVANILCGGLSDQGAIVAMAAAVGIPPSAVRETLSSRSRLMGSQLIRWDHQSIEMGSKWEWVSKGFAEEMLLPGFDPFKALRDRIIPAPTPTLAWDQFAHLGELRQVTLSYVRQALATGKAGVNLLLHGDPGTGKSEFSRALAREVSCELFEVSSQDEDGDALEGGRRLQALRVLHSFCVGRRTMLVFDEIEDVFPKFGHPLASRATQFKGWVNRMLEGNPSITIWITNCVAALDAAFVRRFDLVLEFKSPPTAVREAQLRSLPVALPEAAVRRMAACTNLSSAVVCRAAAVVSEIRTDFSLEHTPRIMELIVNQTLQAQGHGQIRCGPADDSVYDPAYINADFDPAGLVEGIRGSKSARICLYGPPGTGKTAFARWLAGQLGRKILAKRASDLLSRYLGETEKRIAEAFREATESGGDVLLIDEVDSFLQERSRAQRSWEVTQVNEFLTQIEQFEGIFIASTNLVDGLDAASLRRFDFKTRLNYLKPVQARGLLEAHLRVAGVPAAMGMEAGLLESLMNLTPGDFAAIARQHRFKPLASAAAWVFALESECSRKPAFQRQITGFANLA